MSESRPGSAARVRRLSAAHAAGFGLVSKVLAIAGLALAGIVWLVLARGLDAGHAGNALLVPSDGDGDEVPDSRDRCPTTPGLLPDGCPPRDTDADGHLDHQDQCPERVGPAGNGGCPDTDRDLDGVVDRGDRCIDAFGDSRFSGCPAPDADRDGIADPEDRCAERAETWNGTSDSDGCPDRGAAVVAVTTGQDVQGQGKQMLGRVELVGGRLFRSSGELSRSGLEAMDVAAAALGAMRARRVCVVPAGLDAGPEAGANTGARASAGKRRKASNDPAARRLHTVAARLGMLARGLHLVMGAGQGAAAAEGGRPCVELRVP